MDVVEAENAANGYVGDRMSVDYKYIHYRVGYVAG